MNARQDCIDLIRHFEGLHDGDLSTIGLQPKRCPTGYWTEGYGRRVIDKRTGRQLSLEATYEQALANSVIKTEADAVRYLEQDLDQRVERVRSLAPRIPDHELYALASFEFNTGQLVLPTGKFSGLLRAVRARDLDQAVFEFDRWVRGRVNGVLKVLPGLQRRRRAEAQLFLGNDWRINEARKR